MMRWLGFACLLVLLLTLAACERVADPVAACESFTALQSVISEEFTPEGFESWIVMQYALNNTELITIENEESLLGMYVIKWQVAGIWYGAKLNGGVITEVWVTKEGAGEIRMRDLIACFGPPEFYHALYGPGIDGGNYQDFDLFYPSSGVLVIGDRQLSSFFNANLSVTENFPVFHFIIMQPGTVDEMLMQIYGNTTSYKYGAIRPWPGSWEEIVIDTTQAY